MSQCKQGVPAAAAAMVVSGKFKTLLCGIKGIIFLYLSSQVPVCIPKLSKGDGIQQVPSSTNLQDFNTYIRSLQRGIVSNGAAVSHWL